MQCTRARKAWFDRTGSKIVYSYKDASKELAGFEFPCRKCLPCRLNNAREKAVRAWHESQMHENSCFITLTYSDEHLESPRLIYAHWQKFIKDLRDRIGYEPEDRIQTIVTGEYGDQKKRPHWHALVFNYWPRDSLHHTTSDRGDKIFTSLELDKLWGRNDSENAPTQFGKVTIDSANYVARYAAKKLIHGKDQDHDFHPIHKTSSRRAIGRSWIETYWKQTFELGYVRLPNGQMTKIPRYYVDWAQKHQNQTWLKYVTEVRPQIQIDAIAKQQKEEQQYLTEMWARGPQLPRQKTRQNVKETILKLKFKRLQERLKL